MSAGGATGWDIAGLVGGAVVLLGVLGKGVVWLMGWRERREVKIDERWAAYREQIEKDFDEVRAELKQRQAENVALLRAFELVAMRLRAHDPASPELERAAEILRTAFPPELSPLPSGLAHALNNAERTLRRGSK